MIEAGAGLRVVGNFDPDKVAKDLDISPSFITYKGEKVLLNRVVPFNVVGFNSPLDKTIRLEKHLEWIVNKFAGKHEFLRKLKEHNKIDIFCTVTLIGEEGFSLSPKSLSLICNLQISLEVSLITLKDLGEEDLEDGNPDEL